MSLEELMLHVLAVDCRPRGDADDVTLTLATTAAEALRIVRVTPLGLLLTTRDVEGAAIWPLAERVRLVRPKLPWWLVANGITPDEEILARTLGVKRILGSVPTAEQIWQAFAGSGPRRPRIRPPPVRADREDVHARH